MGGNIGPRQGHAVALEPADAGKGQPAGRSTRPRPHGQNDGVSLDRLAVDPDAAGRAVAPEHVLDAADAQDSSVSLSGAEQSLGEPGRMDLGGGFGGAERGSDDTSAVEP